MVSIAEIATIRETGALQNGHGTARDARQVWDRLHQRRESHPAEFTPKRHSGTAGFTYDSDGLHSFARNVLGSATTAGYMRKIVTYLTDQGALLNIGRPGRGAIWWLAAEWPAADTEPVTAIEPGAETPEAEARVVSKLADSDHVRAPFPTWLAGISPQPTAESDSADVRIEISPEPDGPEPAAEDARAGLAAAFFKAPEGAAESAALENARAALAAALDAWVRETITERVAFRKRLATLEAELAAAQARNRQLEEWGQRGLDLLTGDPQD
jgi:hypothetical protein